MNFDSSFLFANLFWGCVGAGYWMYGKRQRSLMPMLGGASMIGASYFTESALIMTLICVALMVGVYVLAKRDY